MLSTPTYSVCLWTVSVAFLPIFPYEVWKNDQKHIGHFSKLHMEKLAKNATKTVHKQTEYVGVLSTKSQQKLSFPHFLPYRLRNAQF